jgi:hypothetical protein
MYAHMDVAKTEQKTQNPNGAADANSTNNHNFFEFLEDNMPEKPWLHKTVGNKGWLITSEKGVELIETKTKLLEKLKEFGLSGNKQCRRLRAKKGKYYVCHFEIKKNGTTLFQISGISEETMWALHDLADIFHSQDNTLFTELAVSLE